MLRAMLTGLFFMWNFPFSAAADGNWDGFYGGVQLGFSDAKTSIVGNRWTYNQNRAVNAVDHTYDGAGGAVFVGWNRQQGSLIFGGELTLGRSDLSSNLVFNSDNDIDQVDVGLTGAVTGRIGYAHENTLFYLKGGVAFADISNLGGDVNGGVLTESDAHRRDGTQRGLVAGAGVQYLMDQDWFLRAEFSYVDFKSYKEANDDGAPGSQFYVVDNGPIRSIWFGIGRQF